MTRTMTRPPPKDRRAARTRQLPERGATSPLPNTVAPIDASSGESATGQAEPAPAPVAAIRRQPTQG